jgi:hypothetical protein
MLDAWMDGRAGVRVVPLSLFLSFFFSPSFFLTQGRLSLTGAGLWPPEEEEKEQKKKIYLISTDMNRDENCFQRCKRARIMPSSSGYFPSREMRCVYQLKRR